MANVSKPSGFKPVGHLTGGEIRTRPYTVTTSQTIYPGDVLKVVANGTVEEAAAGDGIICVGVAAEYIASSAAGAQIEVYDDPNIIFEVQSATAAAVDVFATADHVATTGDTATHNSKQTLAAVTDAQFKIIGLSPKSDNAWGQYAKVLVIFNEHLYKAAVAGV